MYKIYSLDLVFFFHCSVLVVQIRIFLDGCFLIMIMITRIFMFFGFG